MNHVCNVTISWYAVTPSNLDCVCITASTMNMISRNQRKRKIYTFWWSLIIVETNILSPTSCLIRITKSLLLILFLCFKIKKRTMVSMPQAYCWMQPETSKERKKDNYNLKFFIVSDDQVHVWTRHFCGNGSKKHWKGHPWWGGSPWSMPQLRCFLFNTRRCQGLEPIFLIKPNKEQNDKDGSNKEIAKSKLCFS